MSDRLRILTIGHSYVVGINRAIIREVARDPAFEVTVAAPERFHGDLHDLVLEPEPAESPIRLVGLPSRWSRRIHLFHYHDRALRRLVREGKFDLIHAWEEPYVLAGYQIARSLANLPIPFCFWTAQNLDKRLPPPFSYFERATLARSQGWIACGQLVFESLRDRGYHSDRGTILPLAVDLSAFEPIDEPRRAATRDRLGLQAPVIGYMGRLTPEKGISILLAAMERVGGERPWSLLFLGGGPMEPEILRWAEARGWTERVRVALARHHEVPLLLGTMDLLVAPSQTTPRWKEQFGRMLIEGFAAGVPVIGSESGEIPHVIGDSGRIVPEKDVQAWSDAIVELLDRPDLRAHLIEKGRRRSQDFAAPTVAEQYRGFYRWLARQPVT